MSAQVLRGIRTSSGTPGTLTGTATRKIGSMTVSTPSSSSLIAARTMFRVWAMFIRWPTP